VIVGILSNIFASIDRVSEARRIARMITRPLSRSHRSLGPPAYGLEHLVTRHPQGRRGWRL